MYNNIGKKIKGLVKVLLTISIIFIAIAAVAGIIAAFASGMEAGPAILVAIGILIAAALWILITWISTWMLYGYGEIVDKVAEIEKKMPVQPAQTYQQPVAPANNYQNNTTYQQY